jgi:membrane protein DedA with SNARE-associated domain
MSAAIALATATLVSEDLACIAAGLLIAEGRIGVAAALGGCGLGIWLGDLGLWVLGRAGRLAAVRARLLEKRVSAQRLKSIADWMTRRAGPAIVASRVMPGMRFPAYVAAGAAGLSFARFSVWCGIAVAFWTPLLVFGSMLLGGVGDRSLSPVTRWGATLGVLATFGVLAAGRAIATSSGRRSVSARLARWRRWEFWPMWLFYPPVAAWIGWLALRHGGLSTMAAANPGIPDGGTVGESKAAILTALPAPWTIPHVLVSPGPLEARAQRALEAIDRRGWRFPVIMKPDVGQRGVGVKLVQTRDAVRGYLAGAEDPIIVQPFHPGPFEAGVFYYRLPDRPAGRILSITDKEFPKVIGDGASTLSQLVWAHPRYRMQADLFLTRHQHRVDDVIPAGEVVPLAIAGNHAQGTIFRDGSQLVTGALERRIDEIARSFPGFYIGRFDIRYTDVDAFKAGQDLAIVELNGATAESTNIYDPDGSLLNAYRTLFRQWSLVFAIGAANRARGVQGSSIGRLARLAAAHLKARPAFEVSD